MSEHRVLALAEEVFRCIRNDVFLRITYCDLIVPTMLVLLLAHIVPTLCYSTVAGSSKACFSTRKACFSTRNMRFISSSACFNIRSALRGCNLQCKFECVGRYAIKLFLFSTRILRDGCAKERLLAHQSRPISRSMQSRRP